MKHSPRLGLTVTLAALVPLGWAGCKPKDNGNLPPDPPQCEAPPAALTQTTTQCPPAPSPEQDGVPVVCPPSERFCKERYYFPHTEGIRTVEVRGNYRGTGWDYGVPLKLNSEGTLWEGEVYLPHGREVEAKLVVNGKQWNDDPNPEHPGSRVTRTCTTPPVATCQHQRVGEARVCDELDPPENDFDWRDAIMYFAFVDRFFNGDPQNDNPLIADPREQLADYVGGDFAGVIRKLDAGYFTDLGVNLLWLTVPFDNPNYLSPIAPGADPRQVAGHAYTGYHGYWPNDQWPTSGQRVEEHFGTEQELKTLVDKAHARGIKVLFDYAMVHVHEDSPIFRAHAPMLRSGLPVFASDNLTILDAQGQPAWFWPNVALDDNMRPILNDLGRPRECVCGSQASNPCQWDGTSENPLIGTRCAFQGYLPHWNYDVDAALEYSLDAAIRIIRETGVDGYRADAVKHISPRWYEGLRARLRQEFPNKRFYVVGETYDFGSRDNLKRFVDTERALDGQFDFPLRANIASAVLARGNTGKRLAMWELAEFVRTNDNYYGCGSPTTPPPVMSPWIGNHDVVRPIHIAESTPQFDEWANGKSDNPELERTWANLPTQPTEEAAYEQMANAFAVLMTGPGAPLIYYGDEYGLAGGGDPDNRRTLFWTDGTLRGAVSTCGQFALNDRLKRLIQIRKEHPALRRGQRETLVDGTDLWVFKMTTTRPWRNQAPETVYVAINRSDTPQTTCALPAGPMVELMGEQTVSGPGVIIPPRQTRIFVAP